MEGAAPVGPPCQETSEGSSADSASTFPYSHSTSKPSSPCMASTIQCSSPFVSTSTDSILDNPIKVEFISINTAISHTISVPPPMFHLLGYSPPLSTPNSSLDPTSSIFGTTTDPTSTRPSLPNVSCSVPVLKPTPIIGSILSLIHI